MRKTIQKHSEKDNKHVNEDAIPKGAVPAYLMDREGVSRAKVFPFIRCDSMLTLL